MTSSFYQILMAFLYKFDDLFINLCFALCLVESSNSPNRLKGQNRSKDYLTKLQPNKILMTEFDETELTELVLVLVMLSAEFSRSQDVLDREGESSPGPGLARVTGQEPPPRLRKADRLRDRVLRTVVAVVVDALLVVVVLDLRVPLNLDLLLDKLLSEQGLVDEAEAPLLHLLEADQTSEVGSLQGRGQGLGVLTDLLGLQPLSPVTDRRRRRCRG